MDAAGPPGLTIGVLHPGEMGSAIASELVERGQRVVWASPGRGDETRRRARAADLEDVGDIGALAERSDVVLSVCPPHAARDVAASLPPFTGLFVDANAVSPATTREIGALVEATGAAFVDGAIVGPPPRDHGTTRLYLSGANAAHAAALFERSRLEPVVLGPDVGSASALKMAYAAWTKGSQALLLAARALARAGGVEDALLAEWRRSRPDLPDRSGQAAEAALRNGWRWSGEMEEIAATLAASDLPSGFHEAAAEIYSRVPRSAAAPTGDDPVDAALEALRPAPPTRP